MGVVGVVVIVVVDVLAVVRKLGNIGLANRLFDTPGLDTREQQPLYDPINTKQYTTRCQHTYFLIEPPLLPPQPPPGPTRYARAARAPLEHRNGCPTL